LTSLIDPENTRRYYYNYKWQVLCEHNGSDEFQQWYAYGNYIDEVLAMGTGIFASTARFYIHDHLYSPVALTDYSGSVLERYEYDAYGNPYILDTQYAPRTTCRGRDYIIFICLMAFAHAENKEINTNVKLAV
jgi:hypothetical protein